MYVWARVCACGVAGLGKSSEGSEAPKIGLLAIAKAGGFGKGSAVIFPGCHWRGREWGSMAVMFPADPTEQGLIGSDGALLVAWALVFVPLALAAAWLAWRDRKRA